LSKLVTAVAVGALAGSMLAAAPAGGAPARPVVMAGTSSIDWKPCFPHVSRVLADTSVRCAALAVPRDYRDPQGARITLELALVRHTSSAARYKGVILTNPGGPGARGLTLGADISGAVPHDVGADYDWVSWDPRGVGTSRPAIHCQRDYFDAPRRSYVPTTHRLLRYWLKRSKAYADACERKYPELLKNMTTVDSANDMASIRKALGVSTISYYGFSYGTYLGEVYSTLFPTHLKYMVLDSSVDPRWVWYRANLDQDRAFNRNIHIYFRWVAKYADVYHLGATERAVASRYYNELAALTRHPRGRLGPDEMADAFLGAGYYTFGWTGLASAWRAYAQHGRTGGLLRNYRRADQPGNDNEFAVYNAVQCTDVQWPTSWHRWAKDNNAYYRKYPFLTWGNAWFNAPCLYWGAKAHHPVHVNGKATKSALLIDETLDAATPYPGSLEVRRLYPHASLIAEPGGTTHADSLNNDACVDNKIATYLRTGKRPQRRKGAGPDAICKPLPDPVPAAR
jgi:pimeloyl-ACP methyl ester carboxylesterase